MLMYLLEDGLLINTGQNLGVVLAGVPAHVLYQLTPKGTSFIQEWTHGELR